MNYDLRVLLVPSNIKDDLRGIEGSIRQVADADLVITADGRVLKCRLWDPNYVRVDVIR